jgi:hypothetical protein
MGGDEMVTTEEGILSEAARIRASRRRRFVKHCEVCGKPFEGIVQRRFCSDRCRMRAARGRASAPTAEIESVVLPVPREGESFRDFIVRTRAEDVARGEIDGNPAELTPDQEEQIAAIERIWRRQQDFLSRHGPLEDSTELIRQDREERSRLLAER